MLESAKISNLPWTVATIASSKTSPRKLAIINLHNFTTLYCIAVQNCMLLHQIKLQICN